MEEPAVNPSWRKSSYSGNGDGTCVEVGVLPWRKSSYSGDAGGANCVEVGVLPWRKSSYSGSSGQANCVEAGHVPGAVLVRDTTQHAVGPVLRVTPRGWQRFTAAIRATAALS